MRQLKIAADVAKPTPMRGGSRATPIASWGNRRGGSAPRCGVPLQPHCVGATRTSMTSMRLSCSCRTATLGRSRDASVGAYPHPQIRVRQASRPPSTAFASCSCSLPRGAPKACRCGAAGRSFRRPCARNAAPCSPCSPGSAGRPALMRVIARHGEPNGVMRAAGQFVGRRLACPGSRAPGLPA